HELETASFEPLAQPGEGIIAAEMGVYGVAGDGEPRAGDVFLVQVGQRLLKFLAPLRIAARYFLRRQACLPDAQEPDPVELLFGEAVQLGVGNIVERGAPT